MMNIDRGYDFFVDYSPETLHVSLSISASLLNGDANAFWLRLSAFDNLAHTALGTKQREIFDQMNKLATRLAREQLKKGSGVSILQAKADRAVLTARGDISSSIIILMAAATVNDIERMARQATRERDDRPVTWRRILALSLTTFAAGANGYAAAYQNQARPVRQPVYQTTRTCYTNLIGRTAFTTCN